MNNVNFFGRVGSEPKLLGDAGPRRLRVLTDRRGLQGNQRLQVRVVAFKDRAVLLAGRLSEGELVSLSGRLRSEPDAERPGVFSYSVIVSGLHAASEFADGGDGHGR